MKPSRSRVKKVVSALPPRSAVLTWMAEAHAFATLTEYVADLVQQPGHRMPMVEIPDRVEQATRTATRGWPEPEVNAAVRQAVSDVLFLQQLHHDQNVRIEEHADRWQLHALLLIEQLGGILGRQAAAGHRGRARHRLSQLPYPLDAPLGGTIAAAVAHAVETWAQLEDAGTLQDWVVGAFIDEGHTFLPGGAFTWQLDQEGVDEPLLSRMSEDDVRACFPAPQAFEAFKAGTDHQCGLVDVSDTAVSERTAALTAALQTLVAAGEVEAGATVALPEAPLLFLQEAPLVDGSWLDREVLALAEWGAELEKHGYVRAEQLDDHPFALTGWSPAAGKDDEAQALRNAARAHLASFKGRTREIGGRTFVHAADYGRWRARRLHALPDPQPGVVIRSWNAWVTAHGAEGTATLAGVPVGALSCWAADSPTTFHPTADALRLQAERRAVLEELRPDGDSEEEREAAERLREHLTFQLQNLIASEEALTRLSQTYFAGAELLFPAYRELLAGLRTQTEGFVESFNRFVAADLARRRTGTLDRDAVLQARLETEQFRRRAAGPQTAVIVRFAVDHARAKTLENMGRSREAKAIMDRYFTGDA